MLKDILLALATILGLLIFGILLVVFLDTHKDRFK